MDAPDSPRARPGAGAAPRLGAALLPLRLFLGVTFVYAGIQKLSDPGYLQKGAPTYIGTQLQNFAHGTPGGFILRTFAIPHPTLAGVGVALLEIAVGLLVLVGLATRGAAAVGLLLNLLLFLTNSWRTSPYFLGSDIVFVFAWLPFVLAGAREQPALDNELDAIVARRRRRSALGSGRPAPATEASMTRRGLLAQGLGATALGAALIGGAAALARGAYTAPRRLGAGRATAPSAASAAAPAQTTTSTGSAPSGASPKGPAAAVPPGAVKLGPASALPRGQAASYNDPADGSPDILIHNSDGSLSAFSAVCTHAGCQVGYQGGQIVCPCHGGVYNARTGAVEGGPPPAPLAPKRVVERNGILYAFRA